MAVSNKFRPYRSKIQKFQNVDEKSQLVLIQKPRVKDSDISDDKLVICMR